MSIDVTVRANGSVTATTWALNEATVEKSARERMVDVVVEVDGRPLSRWGCDGVVFATPTGSTAYAFSAGGPVVWPEVEALLVVPISAHALFARPMVVSPDSELAAEVIGGPPGRLYPAGLTGGATPGADGQTDASGAVLWCDGRRRVDLPAGARVEVRRGARPVLLARLRRASQEPDGPDQAGGLFTDRLVAKFGLPVQGWRGQARTRLAPGQREEGRSGNA
jgi:NAD+ kinase